MADGLDIARLREALKGATPEPWKLHSKARDVIVQAGNGDRCRVAITDDGGDAALIVAAVNALPALLVVADERDRLLDSMVKFYGKCPAAARAASGETPAPPTERTP